MLNFINIKISVDLCTRNKDYIDTKAHAVCACCCFGSFPNIQCYECH